MHPSSLLQAQKFIDNYLDQSANLLIADVGSYDVNGTYRPLFDKPNWDYVGIDIIGGPNVDIIVPSDDPWLYNNFDVVISGQCLEHVAKPWLWIKQVASLGKPGSIFWITAPNTWGFHEYPIDCWRVWPDGMKALFDEAGLECIDAFVYENDTVGIAKRIE